MKSAYDVLGVSNGASSTEIRAAYVRRAKVLHPDRFDKASQPAEWQMANEMLRELNDAYGQLNGSQNGASNVNNEGTSTRSSPQPSGEPAGVYQTQTYWDRLGQVFTRHEQASGEVRPFVKDNFDEHLGSLSKYVGENFICQQGMTFLDINQVDTIALAAGDQFNDALRQYSSLVTQRITLATRAKQLRGKYPYWKMLWAGYSGLNISQVEFQADELENRTIDPQLEEIRKRILAVDSQLKENLQIATMKLIAKYGNTLRV